MIHSVRRTVGRHSSFRPPSSAGRRPSSPMIRSPSARDLYAAAAYEDALAALDRLRAGGVRVDENRAVDQYRAFCLLALGKSTEAAQAIEAVVSADPSYHPSDSDVSPRVRAAFSDVRRRLLPDLAQQKYAQAKAAFDRKDYRVASDNFGQLLDLFADPDLAAAASRPPLTDLRMLTVGFRDLSMQALAPPPAPLPRRTAAATGGRSAAAGRAAAARTGADLRVFRRERRAAGHRSPGAAAVRRAQCSSRSWASSKW